MITQRGLRTDERRALVALLASVDAFTDDEREVALELVDNRLARPEVDEYRFILSATQDEGQEKLAGYICYGRTPMTQSTYDLYWLATSPSFARMGIARGLVAAMEEEIAREGGGLIRVETGSREGHTAAAHFYDALGFERTAVLEDFYAPDDDSSSSPSASRRSATSPSTRWTRRASTTPPSGTATTARSATSSSPAGASSASAR